MTTVACYGTIAIQETIQETQQLKWLGDLCDALNQAVVSIGTLVRARQTLNARILGNPDVTR